jgi:hypothetical protein
MRLLLSLHAGAPYMFHQGHPVEGKMACMGLSKVPLLND